MSPRPRTSPTMRLLPTAWVRPASSRAPIASALATRLSFSMILRLASPAAHATGWAAYVLGWTFSCVVSSGKASASLRRAMAAESGM